MISSILVSEPILKQHLSQILKNERKTNQGDWLNFVDDTPKIRSLVDRHPNTLWMFTQFTWLTTYLILAFLIFRFYKYSDRVPKWLRWIMKHSTLAMATMYEIIVGGVFWGYMYDSFSKSFTDDLRVPEIIATVFVHAIVPILIAIYSIIFLVRDEQSRKITFISPVKGMIFPVIYTVWYILLTIIWTDPYPATHMPWCFNLLRRNG